MEKPVIGQPVHYVSYGTPKGEFTSQCRAAWVTETQYDSFKDGSLETILRMRVGLCVVNPTGLFFHPLVDRDGIDYSPKIHRGGTWHRAEDHE